MLGTRLVIHHPTVIRILRRLQKFLDQIHRVVQKIIVSFTNVDVQLAFELRTQLGPISLQDVAEIVILSPILSHRTIDLPRQLVPDRFWITVAPNR